MSRTWIVIIVLILLTACNNSLDKHAELFEKAAENGMQANESYLRSMDFVTAWMHQRDSTCGLIPTNLTNKKDIWEPYNSAADNYAFMVLTSYLLDKELYNGAMLDMLVAEKKLTSRVKSLPDIYSFSKQDFKSENIDMDWIVFGSSEYIKDGLLPLTEYIGPSPWQERMMEMINDLSGYHTVIKDKNELGRYHAAAEEVNGEMLQTLSRVFWMTGDKKYLDWAIEIGDYYLVGDRDLSEIEYLRIRDHGCEIIGGLSELYVTLHYADPGKKKQYQKRFYKLLDRVLEVGRNDDGLFYSVINGSTGEIVNSEVVDNWGYTFNAYYSVYLVDHKEEYKQAFLDCINNLNEKYRGYPWEGESHDGYADALESGINLYNREPVPELKDWIDSEMKVMWEMQQENGLIGGWHGDGNFARTAIMYALWKTQGVHCFPWREDLIFGAEMNDGRLFISVSSGKDYQGKLVFDYKRHEKLLHLPIDYPRINQFPEWFTADYDSYYQLISTEKELNGRFSGEELLKGVNLNLRAGSICWIVIE